VNLDWAANPATLAVLVLAIYGSTWAWLYAMLPPFPWIRDKLSAAIERRAREPFQEADGSTSSVRESAFYAKLAKTGGEPTWSYLLTCPHCSGFWIGAAWVLAASLLPAPVWLIPAGAFAASAAAGLLANRE
jgi:uncharacterized protein DUF1360